MKRYVVLCFFWMIATASGQEFVHEGTGIRFPEMVGKLELGKASRYESESGGGIGIPYSSGTIEATVFIRKISAGSELTPEAYLDETLDALKKLEEQGIYSKLRFFRSDGKGDRPGWARAGLSGRSDEAPFVSFIHTTLTRGHAIKIRATSPLPIDKDSMPLVEALQAIIDGRKPDDSPTLEAIANVIASSRAAKASLGSISLMGIFEHDSGLQEELIPQFKQDCPELLERAMNSAGNSHNPQVLPLRQKFSESLLKTPTMVAASAMLGNAGYQLKGVDFEKFFIDKKGAPPSIFAFVWLKTKPKVESPETDGDGSE